jgi:hypothetical protein
MAQAHRKDDQGWHDTVGHENQDESLCSGPFDSQKQDQNTPAACHGFFWGAGPDQLAHEQPEIVPGEPVRQKIEPSQALVISQSALVLKGPDARALCSRLDRHELGQEALDRKCLQSRIIMPDAL